MGAAFRPEGNAVKQDAVRGALEQAPDTFSFFQAVRILEATESDRSPVGGDDADREVVRFSAHPSIAFPPSEIESLERPDGEPPRMTVNFMGLIGPQGVLPLDYTNLVAERVQARDHGLRAFLDIFQHRIISLFYRAWLKYRFLVQRERGQEDTVTTHLLDFAGLGLPLQRNVPGIHATALGGYAGFLSAQPRSAQALEQVLEDYFQVPATVEQFVGDWYSVRRRDQCELGSEERASSRLGLGALAGDEIWDSQAGVRVRLGPLDEARYRSLLPDGSAFAALQTLLRYFSHGEHEFEVQLVLDAADVPGVHLGVDEGQRLAWTTWLRTRQPARAADQTIIRIEERNQP